jgi:WD40 repeat protein
MVTIASGFTRGKRWHAGQALTCIAWSPHGRVAGDATQVEVWDVQTSSINSTYTGHTDIVTSVSWSPCSRYIASASKDGTVQIWYCANLECSHGYH